MVSKILFKIISILTFGIVLLLTQNCAVSNKQSNMKFTPKEFNEVVPNSKDYYSCSPQDFYPEGSGIIITAPKEAIVNLKDDKKYIIICGDYIMETANLEEFPQPMLIHIYHIETDKNFSGFLQDRDPSPVAPMPKKDGIVELDEKSVIAQVEAIGSYFNPDILTYVKFPLLPGSYIVYVEYGGIKSNEVLINVKIQ